MENKRSLLIIFITIILVGVIGFLFLSLNTSLSTIVNKINLKNFVVDKGWDEDQYYTKYTYGNGLVGYTVTDTTVICSEEIIEKIAKLHFNNFDNCFFQKVKYDGEPAKLITLKRPPMDCQSGCINIDSKVILLENETAFYVQLDNIPICGDKICEFSESAEVLRRYCPQDCE